MLLRATTRQTGSNNQGDHEAHSTSCNEPVSVSYLLSLVMMCPNFVGMESPQPRWGHQILQWSPHALQMLHDTTAPKRRDLWTPGFWKLLASCECGKMRHVATSKPSIWTVWMPGRSLGCSRGPRARSDSPLILSLSIWEV